MLVRELTKLHEETWRGTLGEAVAHHAVTEPRGEYVVVLAGAPDAPLDLDAALRAELAAGRRPSDAASTVANVLGVPKRAAYARAMELARS